MAILETEFKISAKEFENFRDCMSDLNKLSKTHRLYFSDTNKYMYYSLGGDATKITKVKMMYGNTDDIFSGYNLNKSLFITLFNTDQVHKQLVLLEGDVDVVFRYTDTEVGLPTKDSGVIKSYQIYNIIFKDKFFDITISGTNTNEVACMGLNYIKSHLNPDNTDDYIEIPKDIYEKIKKLTAFDKSNDIVAFRSNKKDVIITDSAWNCKIDNISKIEDGKEWLLHKDFTTVITPGDKNIIYFFDSYVLVKEKNGYSLLTVELTD